MISVKNKLLYRFQLTISHAYTLSLQVISADGELNAARALKEAAETIASSRTAMQLRYLQTLNIIAAERGSTIMFPIPIDILGGMQGAMGVSEW